MYYWPQWCILSVIISLLSFADCVELTFELPDNAKECFYQDIGKNVSSTLEFQVLTNIFGVMEVFRLFYVEIIVTHLRGI